MYVLYMSLLILTNIDKYSIQCIYIYVDNIDMNSLYAYLNISFNIPMENNPVLSNDHTAVICDLKGRPNDEVVRRGV